MRDPGTIVAEVELALDILGFEERIEEIAVGGGTGAPVSGVSSHNDLTDVTSDQHHAKYTDAEAEIIADAQIAIHTAIAGAHHTKTVSGDIDHGSISGLGDNDHTQYLLLAGGVMSGELTMTDDNTLWFDTAESIGFKYSTVHGGLHFTDDQISIPGALTIYGNTAADASGIWSPFMQWNAGGEFIIQADGGTLDRVRLQATDGIVISSRIGGNQAIYKDTNVSGSNKTFEVPNVSGTFLLKEQIDTVAEFTSLLFGVATTELDNLGTVAINTSLISDTDSTDDLGSTTKFWANAYTDKLLLNSTATLDGATAGQITTTGNIVPSVDVADDLGNATDGFGNIYTNILNSPTGRDLKVLAEGFTLFWGVVGKMKIYAEIYPYFDSVRSLGDATHFFKNFYIDNIVGPTVFNEAGADVDFRFETNNEDKFFVIDGGLDVARFGDFDTNYIQFAVDGKLTLVGTARIIKHLHFVPELGRGQSAPTIRYTEDPYVSYTYAINDDSHMTREVPQDMDYTVASIVKIHWYTTDATADGVDEVRWEVQWASRAVGENITLGDTTGNSGDIVCSAANIVIETTTVTIPADSITAGDMLGIHIERVALGEGTNPSASSIHVLDVELEYTSNKLGEAT